MARPLTTALMKWFWDHYADPSDRSNPKAAPLRGDLAGLPPAVVVTADFDPLRDMIRAEPRLPPSATAPGSAG